MSAADWQQVVVGVITICIFLLMFLEAPPDIVFFVGKCAMRCRHITKIIAALVIIMLCEILLLEDVLKGFSNESLITIGALFLVVGAVQKSHIMDYLARQAFGVKSSNTVGSARMMCSLAVLSAVFNNIPLCNLMIPIVRDWARSRSIPLSHLLMPVSFAVIGGGLCTMIGTSTSLIVQGIMQADIGYSFPFFAPGIVGVPATVLMIIYMLCFAPILLPSRSGLIREVRDRAGMFVAEVQVSESSAFIANDVGTFVGKLGIQLESIIKIRRRCHMGVDGAEAAARSAHDAEPGDTVDYAVPSVESLRLRKSGSTDTYMRSSEPGIELSQRGCTGIVLRHATTAIGTSNIKDKTYVRKNAEAWGATGVVSTVDDIGINDFRVHLGCESEREAGSRLRAYSHGDDRFVDLETGESTHRFHLGGLLSTPVGSVHGSIESVPAESDYRDIINPSRFEVIRAGDVIFIASAGMSHCSCNCPSQ